jgi:class 3 adenylate cyclase/tetratricopeptide (TPR) repeat protein
MGGVAIVVFSDLVDSTALLASLGDDRMELVRRAHVEDVDRAVEDAGGRVVKTLGDGVMASFESALGALRAAAEIQAAVERLDAAHGAIGIAARVGVAAGEPIRDGEDLHGMSVVIASRLSSAAGTGEVLVQDLVRALVASRDGLALGEPRDFELKGVPAPVRASRLLWRELAQSDGGDGAVPVDAGSPDAPERPDGSSAPLRPPPILAAYAEEPLIGRDREIAMLREETAPRPGRRAVVILGEPGIGKTRHAAAAAAEAHAKGATVVLARCPPETVIPFEPWVRAIGELALAGDEAWRNRLATAAGPELSALVPELDRVGQPDDQSSAGGMIAAEGARYRLLRGVGAALGCAAGDGPLHVVLDDAQWCDPASAQALGHLLDSPPVAELVLVVTAREGEMGRGHPVSKALSHLRRTDDLSELRLTGLDARGMAALVGARVGRAITPALAARLLERTSGNPFFAGELVRDLDGRGGLRDDDALDAVPVPEAVTGLVEERLGHLDPATERLLTAVAAIGPSAPVALAAKAAGLEREAAERAARDALSERLVEDVATAEPTIAFTHALVREALLAETGDATRARLHLAIARALEEDPASEPAELARHYGLSVELTGAEPAIAAHRAAAAAAADGHDHEGAAAHLRQTLALLPEADPAARAPTLLELGEQELLSADLVRARDSFQEAIEAARETGDAGTLARAAIGFAGGDIGFGVESGVDNPVAAALLREALEALGDSEPRLALRTTFRLAYMLVYTDDDDVLASLRRRAEDLERRLGDAEARVLSGLTVLATRFARRPDPTDIAGLFEEMEASLDLLEPAAECGREDLLFRVVQWSAAVHYTMARIPECDRAIERAAEIASRLGSPRFAWEVDFNRSMRLFDRGRRDEAETLLRRAGAGVRRLRPDLHIFAELSLASASAWIYGGETGASRLAFEAIASETPGGVISAGLMSMASADGDVEGTRRALRAEFDRDLEGLRHPDGNRPVGLCWLAHAAIQAEDREAGARLRPLLEPMRSRLGEAIPVLGFGQLPEWYIGSLELLAGHLDAAVAELRAAVARADELELVWVSAWSRVDLATALHRSGETEQARIVLVEAESIASRHGVGWAANRAEVARAEIEGREAPRAQHPAERGRPIRALAARGGRRALATMARGLGDEDLEHRFAEPRRQRALMRAMARGFQPAQASGFNGTIVYELEPYAMDPPPDAPWRWAIEVDSVAGRARLVEPAPLDPAVTIHFGLADWVRVTAGIENPLSVMVTGRCSVEGDVMVAARQEAMFGTR